MLIDHMIDVRLSTRYHGVVPVQRCGVCRVACVRTAGAVRTCGVPYPAVLYDRDRWYKGVAIGASVGRDRWRVGGGALATGIYS